jgi:hypothetical protein
MRFVNIARSLLLVTFAVTIGANQVVLAQESSDAAHKRWREQMKQRREARRLAEASAPSFDPEEAPSPAKCLTAYLKAVRRATSMKELLPLMTSSQRHLLEERQRHYDPRAAARAREHFAERGLDEAAIEHLSSSPYDNALKFKKEVASKVLEILSVKTDGNHADVEVAIERTATINGKVYTHSTATIGMVGEGNKWYYATYKEGNWFTP